MDGRLAAGAVGGGEAVGTRVEQPGRVAPTFAVTGGRRRQRAVELVAAHPRARVGEKRVDGCFGLAVAQRQPW